MPLQAVAAALQQQGGRLPSVLYRPPAADGAASSSSNEAALLGQEEWEAAFERAVLDQQAFEREASLACDVPQQCCDQSCWQVVVPRHCHGQNACWASCADSGGSLVRLSCPISALTTSMHLQVSSFFEGSSEEGSLPHVLRQLGIQPTPLQVASN